MVWFRGYGSDRGRLVRLSVALALMAGCASQPQPSSPVSDAELLSGRVLFGEPVSISEAPRADILGVDDAMRHFARGAVLDAPHPATRLRRLVDAMIDDGLLTLDYDPDLTQTAQETFYKRQGNCLSFTNLFVALARQADLEPEFQLVEIPPSWLGEGDFVILNNHINVVVRDIRVKGGFTRDYVVDFNTAEFNGNYDTRRVGDDYAFALYYSNVAVEAMQRGADRLAFATLLRAIEANPEVPSVWINLGALYSRKGHLEGAETAYLHALGIDRADKSALTNLASLYRSMGRSEAADYYEGRVKFYRDRNPYYHYWLAGNAYKEENYDEALRAVNKAIHLKPDEHQFYYLRGLVYLEMGDRAAARENMAAAAEHAQQSRLHDAYSQKLEALRGGPSSVDATHSNAPASGLLLQ